MLSLALHARIFINPPVVVAHPAIGFIHWLLQPFQNFHPIVLAGIHQLLVLVAAFRFNYVLDELKMFPRQTLASAVMYVLLSALFISWNNIIPALFINILLIWVFYKMAKSYNTQRPRTMIYNVGLITGCVILMYYPAVALVAIAVIALAIIRPFRINEWFIVLLGILTPFYFLGVILFMQDDFASFRNYIPHLQWQILQKTNSQTLLLNMVFMLFLLILGVFYWQTNTGRMLIQVRKYWSVLLIMLLVLIPMPLLLSKSGIESAMLIILPLSGIATNIFVHPRQSLMPGLVFWMFVIVIILNQWVLRS